MQSSPLSNLTADEIGRARAVVLDQPGFADTTRFAYVGLEEPSKTDVLSWERGTGPVPDRRVRLLLLDIATGAGRDVVVSLAESGECDVTVSDSPIDGSNGHVPILLAEFDAIAGIVAEDPRWVEALAKRDLTPNDVVCVPLSAGHYGYAEEAGRRILRVFAFRQDHPHDHPWAHPVDGLTAYVDAADRRITQLIDTRTFPVPNVSGNFDDTAEQGTPLSGLKPISITQPEGPSFSVDGEVVSWAKWRVGVSFDMREGLVLRQISFDGRPILYRASINEMVVPYADPSPTRFWQNYFDTGEYLFGRFTNSLQFGCDCVGEIHYFDAIIADELGQPQTIQNGICLHEEDAGILWKHTDMFTGSNESRRQRRLVISTFTTVGNYDYGFYWYLYLDGTIEFEVKLTGFLFTSAYPADGQVPYPYASEVAEGLGAPYHQHLFSARLDITVDETANSIDEIDAQRVPRGAGNEAGNAFTKAVTRLRSEQESGRSADSTVGRVWQISSANKVNALGRPTAYVLQPTASPTLLADTDASVTGRAGFATQHLFVTKYDPRERYAAGDFVHQHPGGGGIPEYIADDASIENEDIVLWHTFGLTHFPRPEDWPVMPVDQVKFALKPYGFFDRNPTLDIPSTEDDHCAPHSQYPHG